MSRENMFYWQSDRPYTANQINSIFLQRTRSYNKNDLIRAASHAYQEEISSLNDPINFGSVNIVCPFVTLSGKEGVIRAHPSQVTNEYFYAESEAMKLAASVGVPVPETIAVDTSRSIVPFDYMVTSRVPGEVMQLAVERDSSLYVPFLRQIGVVLGKLHTINTNGYGFFDNNQAQEGILRGVHASNQDHYLAALESDTQFYENNQDWIDIKLVRQAIRILQSNAEAAKCDKPTLIHNDIADWNTVVDNTQVTGILDWDECFSGDPVFEFATLSLFYNKFQLEMILDGYQESNRLPHDYGNKIDLYTLRYIISKSKISINKLKSVEKESTRKRFNQAVDKLGQLINKYPK